MKLWKRRSHHHFWDSLSNQLLKEESRSCNTLNLCNQFDNNHKIYTTMFQGIEPHTMRQLQQFKKSLQNKPRFFSPNCLPLHCQFLPLSVCVYAHTFLTLGLTEFLKSSKDFGAVQRRFMLKARLTKYQIQSQTDGLGLGGEVHYPWFI